MSGAPGRLLSFAHLTSLDSTPPELVSAAADAGFGAVGIRLTAAASVGVPPYQVEMLRDSPMRRETLNRLRNTGLRVLDTEFLRFESDVPNAIPDGFLETSALLGASEVLVMSAEPDEQRTLERYVDLCERAAQYGLFVGLELARYTGVKSLAQAERIVRAAGQPNVSIIVDVLHFSRSGGTPADIQTVDPKLYRYAQVCDVVAEMPTDDAGLIREARTGRKLPGDGVYPLPELLAALPSGLPLSVEAPCPELASLSAGERARRAMKAMQGVLAATGRAR